MSDAVAAGPLLFLVAIGSASAAASPQSALVVRVTNVRNSRGEVHVDVCPQTAFLKDDCPYAGAAPAHVGVTQVLVRGVPPGRYAVQTFHDENSNHKVDRALFGIPREGVGFSRDAPIRLGPPRWADAVFAYDGGEQTIEVTTRYFMGSSGPARR